jgi:hypothetical protein
MRCALVPGETPMVADMLAKEPDAMKDILRAQPIGRLGRPEEIASPVLWLCSPGSSFVIGHALAVDGGFTAHWGRKARDNSVRIFFLIGSLMVFGIVVGGVNPPSRQNDCPECAATALESCRKK